MKRKKGEITHMTLQEYVVLNRLPEPPIEMAASIKAHAERICKERNKEVITKAGAGSRCSQKISMFPIEILDHVFIHSKPNEDGI